MISKFMIITSIIFIILTAGCGPKFSSVFSESLSENYALAAYGAEASNPRTNDGDVKTWGVVEPPDRTFTITLPEKRKIDRVVIYSRNVLAYELYGWDSEADKWELVGAVGSVKGRQRVYSDRHKMDMPRFDHRVKTETDKIRLKVTRAESDGLVTTRTPGKNDRIMNHRVEYIGTGRRRVRIDIYDVYVTGPAAIREIELYSYVEKTVNK
jgi:hypothetical protein